MVTLRLVDRAEGAQHVVDMALEGDGPRRATTVQVEFGLSARDREDVRWYLEDYLQYPVDPAPQIAAGVEARLAELGTDLFQKVFRASPEAMELWFAVKGALPDARVEVATGVEGAAGIPWELLRDPATDGAVAVRAAAFVRALAESAAPVAVPEAPQTLRVLLVICRPGRAVDVPFRSVASHLVRLSRDARQVFDLDVLRPPTYAKLTQVLQAAKAAGSPYHVVHFDGHGAWLDDNTVAVGSVSGFDWQRFSVLSPARPGPHGYLVFEDPLVKENQQLVDGPALGQLLVDMNVPVLVLNACRSAHAGLATEPEHDTGGLDAHGRVRAYGSLAQEVMNAGVAGVVAMAYNVYVVTAAQFIGNVYTALLEGQPLGAAVTAARRQLAASPLRQVSLQARPLQDWLVPVVYEAAPIALRPAQSGEEELSIDLDQTEAGKERAALEPGLPGEPDVGFFGRDETLLALDRAFDSAQVVLLHAWAGAGKTSTALEFARWYVLTGGVQGVLLTSFEHHLTLARLLDQIGTQFDAALQGAKVQWDTLDDAQRRDVALQVLAQVPVLWVWDNIEPVTGFPAGTLSAWTSAEQDELLTFLRDLADHTSCKVLLTSRRDEQAWLEDTPARVALPPMPMLERLELAQAVARRQTGGTQAFLEVEDWRPLLEFTQGNPLTVTILARQAVRGHHTTRQQIEAFVAQLRAGAAIITDDATQGRSTSLAASLDYGFTQAFTEQERAILALLALFQGFIDTDALTAMSNPAQPGGPVPAVAGLDREDGIALLDRAAEVGLLTAYGGGYYAVHPAVPWHLQHLFGQHYGSPGSLPAQQATRAWTEAIRDLGNYYHEQESEGHLEVIGFLGLEEANLLQARHLARQNDWWDLIIGNMQGLRALYGHTGRAVEWRRLVDELIPLFTIPTTGGPVTDREEQWAILNSYRVRIARENRDWDTAGNLLNTRIARLREQAAEAISAKPQTLNSTQRNAIRNLAISVEELGHLLRDQEQRACVDYYLEAIKLFQRIGARREEAVIAFNLGNTYQSISELQDIDKSEHWYQQAIELFGDDDTVGRAGCAANLGALAYQRFLVGREATGATPEQLLQHLDDAVRAYQEALQLYPPTAEPNFAVIYNQLGIIYSEARDTDRALEHFQKAIHYYQRQNNSYAAGESRFNTALSLVEAGRHHDALLYARAALRDYQGVGPGAATKMERARRLITRLEHDLSGGPKPSTRNDG